MLEPTAPGSARSQVIIPLVAIETARSHVPLIERSTAFESIRNLFHDVAMREPPVDDAGRWYEHVLAGRVLRFGQPLTFTPYASAKACSARCRFCSETLVDESAPGRMAAALRPGPDYFAALRAALGELKDVPLSYSLSGLESTDDPEWLLGVLDVCKSAAESGPKVGDVVMYTHGGGFAADDNPLLPALAAFGASWFEWSRHHDSAEANQRIMRFREGQRIAEQAVFEAAVHRTVAQIPVKLVCLVQRGGVETIDDVYRYVRWAENLGVRTVIFREFSRLPAHYRENVTRRYIDGSRVAIDGLVEACASHYRNGGPFEPAGLTSGYYFWNTRWQTKTGTEIVFECSDYGAMLAHEASGLIYKLVFHANGNLCSGWQPDRGILWNSNER